MTDIIADPQRGEYIAGLRQLAYFLEQTPAAPCFGIERFLVPMRTNAAVEELATALGGPVVDYDDEGNASFVMAFGPIEYHVYGYVDFAEHLARRTERDARRWAERQGMEIRPAAEQSAEFRPVVPLAQSPAAQAPADGPAVTA